MNPENLSSETDALKKEHVEMPEIDEDKDEHEVYYPFIQSDYVLEISSPILFATCIASLVAVVVISEFFKSNIIVVFLSTIVVLLSTYLVLKKCVYYTEPPMLYNPKTGFEFWTKGDEKEIRGTYEEICTQFPMQNNATSTSIQKLGTIIGFGFLLMTSYSFYIR